MNNIGADFVQLISNRINDFKSDMLFDCDVFNVHFELHDGSTIDFYNCNRSLPIKLLDLIDISQISYFYYYAIGVEI